MSALIFLTAALLSSHGAWAADDAFDEMCGEGAELEALTRFDSELRNALATGNTAQLALLVSYPLRVNAPDGGTRLIADPKALQADFGVTFTTEVISAVLASKRSEIACWWKGIMYDRGTVWVYPVEFEGTVTTHRIGVVNLPSGHTRLREGESLLEFVCRTEKHRAVVDSNGSGYRYRVWNRPRAASEPPDAEITAARDAMNLEGTGPCAAKHWSFPRGNVEYMVGELGCTAGEEPEDARGRLEVAIDGEIKQSWWCR